jgi:hypothetical protein
MILRFVLIGLCAAFMIIPETVLAHDARPLSISITEMGTQAYRVDVLVPPSIDLDNQPEISWPPGCTPASQNVRDTAESIVETMLLRCAASLESARIDIKYPLFNPAISTLFRFNPVQRCCSHRGVAARSA